MWSRPETPYEQNRIDALANAVAMVPGVDEAYLIEVEARGWKGTKLWVVPAKGHVLDKVAGGLDDAWSRMVPEHYRTPIALMEKLSAKERALGTLVYRAPTFVEEEPKPWWKFW